MGPGILAWVVIGGLAGWLAGLITGTQGRRGCLLDIALGIVGGLLGGAALGVLGGAGVTGLNIWSLFVATAGAVILLWAVRVLRGT